MTNPIKYAWDWAVRKFRDLTSRKALPRTQVRVGLDATLDAATLEAKALAERLASGAIDRVDWLRGMKRLTKDAVVACGAVGAGGRANLTPATLGLLGGRVAFQYRYLDSFAREVDAGLPLDAAFVARCRLYPLAGTGAYEAVLRRGDEEAGFSRERRVLNSGQSCPECIAYAARGWVPIGTLPGIGQACSCKTNCRCQFVTDRGPDAGFAASGPVDFKGGGGGKKPPGGKGKLSGGHWVTIHGHPAYIKGGKVVAGGLGGVTHDARRQPSGVPVKLDRADAAMARRHVVRKAKADRARKNAPGRDATGVDHAAIKAHVEARGGAYSHGPPRSAADRKHLAEAEKKGGVAVKVETRPKVRADRLKNSIQYHVGDEMGVAHVSRHKGEGGTHRVTLADPVHAGRHGVEHHRTLKGADAAARKHAARYAEGAATTRRFVASHRDIGGKPEEVASEAIRRHPGGGHEVRVRVLHRGRGGDSADAKFRAPPVEFAPPARVHSAAVEF